MFLSVLRAIAVLAAVALASVHASPAASNETSILEGRQGLAQVITSCTVPDTAALTFDDGPHTYVIVRVSNCRSFLTLSHPSFFLSGHCQAASSRWGQGHLLFQWEQLFGSTYSNFAFCLPSLYQGNASTLRSISRGSNMCSPKDIR